MMIGQFFHLPEVIWSSSILVVFHFDRLRFWLSSLLVWYGFTRNLKGGSAGRPVSPILVNFRFGLVWFQMKSDEEKKW